MTALDDARAATLQSLFRRDLRLLSDEELRTEAEYCSRQIAFAGADPAELGDTMIPPEVWRDLYAERCAWLEMEIDKRERIAGLYRRADTGFTGEYVEDVKRRIDLAEFIVERHPNTKLKWYGGRDGLLGFCPWHSDLDHKSLGVWPRPEWHWFCFACLSGGDVLNWLLKGEARDFREAVRIAAQYAGVSPPQPKPRSMDVYRL